MRELTVKRISELLGYEVKIIKESEKLILKHGDIVQDKNRVTRVILKYKGNLIGFNEISDFSGGDFDLDSWAKRYGYKKIRNIFNK